MKVLIFASVLIVFVASNPVKRNCDGCEKDGISYAVNETWTTNCVQYKCVADGQIGLVIARCPQPNNPSVCRSVGETWQGQHVNGDSGYCATYTCIDPAGNILPYATATDLQCRYKGTCFADGTYLDIEDCVRRTCNITGNSIETIVSATPDCDGVCIFNNVTYDAGTSWLHNCFRYTCTGQAQYTKERECCAIQFGSQTLTYDIGEFTLPGLPCNSYYCDPVAGFTVEVKGCVGPNNTCVNTGDEWSENCFQYGCVDNGFAGSKSFLGGGCYDSENSLCRSVGESWDAYNLAGAPRDNSGICYTKTCSQSGNTFSITNSNNGCALDGLCYPLGSILDYDVSVCEKFTCYFEGSTPKLRYYKHCQDSNGNCHDYGTTGWPFILAGQQCQDCTCDLVDNTVVYSCGDYQ